MEDSAFAAGVVPGGLTTHREIKILICYLLAKRKSPVQRSIILEALSTEGLANYFECADAMSDLENLGHIVPKDGGYIASETGVNIAGILEGDIPLTVKERASEYLENYIVMQRNKNQHHVEMVPRGEGYMVRCSISDFGSDVFAVEVFAPNKKTANEIRDTFIDNAEEIMRAALSSLVSDFE